MRNVRVDAAHEVHIASFIVQHRAESAIALAEHLRMSEGAELAIAGEFRSIVLCEGENQHALVDRIDELRAIPGVINVTLVYHHAEPGDALDAPLATPAGAPNDDTP